MKINDYKSIWVSKTTALRLRSLAARQSTPERTVKQSELADRVLSQGLKKIENKLIKA